MKLSDFIDIMTKQERAWANKGYSVVVEVKDEHGVFTQDISISTEIIFPANRVTIRLEPKETS